MIFLGSTVSPNQPVVYYIRPVGGPGSANLQDGPKRGFVSEELQVVPYDTELPPDSVLK